MSASSQFITLLPTTPSIKALQDESFRGVNNSSTNTENERRIHDSIPRHNPCPSLTALKSLAAQSSSSRSLLSKLPACRTFSKILSVREETEPNQFKVQRPLSNVKTPHAHDVLCGRGNHVNCHPGNEYYRALVKRYFPEYVSTPKPDKPRIALNIHRAVRMRDPPGRFLKQDKQSKLWTEINDQKAMNKTRQALREGVNVTRNALMEDDPEANYHESETQTTFSDRKRSALPLHGSSPDTTPTTHDKILADRAESTDKRIPQVVFTETDQSQAISVASRLINLKGGSTEIQPNMVPSNIIGRNGAPNENLNEKYDAISTRAAGVINGRSNHPLTNLMNANTNAVDTMAKTHDPLNGITSRIAQNNISLPIDSLISTITSRNAAFTKKRIGTLDNMEEETKRLKTHSSSQSFSPANDFGGAAALLAMSYSRDNIKATDSGFGSNSSFTNNRVSNTAPQSSPTPPQNVNRIWEENSCRSHMQCDICLGTGTLPIPVSGLMSQYKQSAKPSTSQDSSIANLKETSSSGDESRKPSTIQLHNEEQANSYGDVKSNTALKMRSAWIEKIREAEKKWGILPDENTKYPERIKVIERKSDEYKRVLQRANKSFSSCLENEEIFSLKDAEEAQKNLEEAERKYGITPLKDHSCAERVKVVERATSLYKLEQEERNWGLVSLQHRTCEERAQLVNQTAIAYMKRLGPLF